jgi:hypothetical protein
LISCPATPGINYLTHTRRVVHAKAAGAWGEFEVTNPEIAKLTCAKFLDTVGKKTQVLFRLSTTGGEKGSADTVRDVRGFSVKFYTEEGNYDIVGNHVVSIISLSSFDLRTDMSSLSSSFVTRCDSPPSTAAISDILPPTDLMQPW